MPKEQQTDSVEYVWVPVDVRFPPGHDITTDVVQMGFTLGHNTRDSKPPTAWFPGIWQRNGTQALAGCLVGPVADGGLVALDRGDWVVWVWVTDNPEKFKKAVDILTIY